MSDDVNEDLKALMASKKEVHYYKEIVRQVTNQVSCLLSYVPQSGPRKKINYGSSLNPTTEVVDRMGELVERIIYLSQMEDLAVQFYNKLKPYEELMTPPTVVRWK